MKYINGKYYGLFTEVNLVENPTDLQIFNCVDTGVQYRFFEGKWYKQPYYWVDSDDIDSGGGGGSELPRVTSADNGDVLTVVNGVWNKAEPAGGSDLPVVTSADNGDVLTVVNGAWDKAEPSGGSDLPVVTSADNGNVLGVVGGEWSKTNPGYTITRQRLTLFENELLISETVGGYVKYSFDELTRESDLPDIPGYTNTCWIRLPDEFVQGVKDGKVNVGFQIDSEPMPVSMDASCEYSAGGLEDPTDRVYVYLEAYYEELGKNPIAFALRRGSSGLEMGAEYLDDSTDPALDDPDDYGWYFRARRSNFAVFGTLTSITEYSATLPETLRATVYLELVDVEFDPSYKDAIVNVAGQTPTPTLTYDSDFDTRHWLLANFDPDKADPDVFVNSATIPALIRTDNYYLANDPAVEGYAVSSYPLSGSLYVGFDLVDGGYVPNLVEISGTSLVFIADPSDAYSLVAARLECYYAECFREPDLETGEYGEWNEWGVSRDSITDLTTLTTYESTPLGPEPM